MKPSDMRFSDALFSPPPHRTLGIPRSEMPQVDSPDVNDFLMWSGFKHKRVEGLNPKTLKATQRDFNMDKVSGMMTKPNLTDKPIMVSKDNYVVDGHHRWLAAINANKKLPIIKIQAPIHDILNKIKGYPKVYSKTVAEARGIILDD